MVEKQRDLVAGERTEPKRLTREHSKEKIGSHHGLMAGHRNRALKKKEWIFLGAKHVKVKLNKTETEECT